jgi:hypothetical protein
MGYTDLGPLTMAEVNARMEAEPDVKFVLRISDQALEYERMDNPAADADDWDPESPGFQLWHPDQVPTDDFQRTLHLLRIDPHGASTQQ